MSTTVAKQTANILYKSYQSEDSLEVVENIKQLINKL